MAGMAMLAAAGCLAAATDASIINFESNPGLEGLGSYTGSMEWTYLGGNAGLLDVRLTNTSPAENGGYLTGFAFNMRYELQMKIADNGARAGWSDIVNPHCNPFGVFDHGVAVGGDWLGGGNPHPGVGVGQTFAFRFDVRGDPSILQTVIPHDFFDESAGIGFVARFRGFDDGGSDKVTASMHAPGAAAVLLLSAVGARRRRR